MELKDIVLIGRSFDEYSRMFLLDHSLLKRNRLLDAASGVSSFSAEASAREYDVPPRTGFTVLPGKKLRKNACRD